MSRLKQLWSSGALTSVTNWGAVLALLAPIGHILATGGHISIGDITTVIGGLAAIFGRANPNIQPLASK